MCTGSSAYIGRRKLKKRAWCVSLYSGDEVPGIFKKLKLRSIYIHRFIFEEVDVEPAGSRGNGVTGRTGASVSEAR
jgi:hypothetical protein